MHNIKRRIIYLGNNQFTSKPVKVRIVEPTKHPGQSDMSYLWQPSIRKNI